MGAYLTLEVVEEFYKLYGFIPAFREEVREFGAKVLPEGFGPQIPSLLRSPEEGLEIVHTNVDDFFGTNQAWRYSPETKEFEESLYGKTTNAVILLPGQLVNSPKGGQIGLKPLKYGERALTTASKTRGCKVGQPIHNRTASGNVPTWSTVRRRYWKNRAHFHLRNTIQKIWCG